MTDRQADPALQEGTRRTLQTLLALGRTSVHRLLRRTRLMFSEDPGLKVDQGVALAGAEALAHSAGQLKGGIAKVAQLMAYLDGPDPLHQEARGALGTLFDQVPAGAPADISRVIAEDLGLPPEQLFASWERQSFAAASLGEVHGATGKDGTEYAVKVQYPGIAASLVADLGSDVLAHKLAGAALPGRALSDQALQALRDAILQEVDYLAEARWQERFREAFAPDPQVVVPRTYPTLCSTRVLTADRLRGRTLSDFVRDAPADARSTTAATLFRFGFGAPLVHGIVNADPNPGNYLILDEGARVGFLDFGCCAALPEDVLTCERVLWQALLAGDGEVLRYALHREGLVLQAVEFNSDRYRRWERCLALPFATHDFTWTSAYASELAVHTSALVKGRRFTLPAGAILLWRQRLGLAAILGQLGARGDFRGALLALLRAVGMAPAGVS